MSASMRPTRWPSRESAMARLTATVVLPTPPLPEPTATILETLGKGTGAGILGAWAMVLLLLKNSAGLDRVRLAQEGSIKRPKEAFPQTDLNSILAAGADRASLPGATPARRARQPRAPGWRESAAPLPSGTPGRAAECRRP